MCASVGGQKSIAMHFAVVQMPTSWQMRGAMETKMAAGWENDD
jgi:hypothetical protein